MYCGVCVFWGRVVVVALLVLLVMAMEAVVVVVAAVAADEVVVTVMAVVVMVVVVALAVLVVVVVCILGGGGRQGGREGLGRLRGRPGAWNQRLLRPAEAAMAKGSTLRNQDHDPSPSCGATHAASCFSAEAGFTGGN